MGWSSTVIAPPDGAMGPYLASLKTLIAAPYSRYLPGHGDAIADGVAAARGLLAHREARNAEVLERIAQGATTPGELVARIYPTLAPRLRPAALATLRAHLDYLVDRGAITRLPGRRRRYARTRDTG
jgi:glyoxylase-like metal-dependent hydrolase (beta-lactamase superfamily II)